MAKSGARPTVEGAEPKYWTSAAVEKLEPDNCDFCELYDDRTRPATHVVTITHWYGPWGATARHHGCEQHARAIAATFAAPSNVGRAGSVAAEGNPQGASKP